MNDNKSLKTEEIVRKLVDQSIDINQDQGEKLQRYMEKILERNENVNLTAITDPEEFLEKHYADSLFAVGLEEYREAKTVIDVGTGGGFPGIPLAIYSPEKDFTLLDSLNKRLKIIQEVSEELGILNVDTVHGRAEDLGRSEEYRESFDLCVSRAVAELGVLAELCLPFVKSGGCFLAYKSLAIEEELRRGEKAIRVLGGRIKTQVPCGGNHQIVVIEKMGATPKKYPRKPGEPGRNPIK